MNMNWRAVSRLRGLLLAAWACACGLGAAGPAALGAQESRTRFIAFPVKPGSLLVLRDGREYLRIGLEGWGPRWAYLHFKGGISVGGEASAHKLETVVRRGGAKVTVTARMARSAPNRLALGFTVASDKDTALTYIVLCTNFPAAVFGKAKAKVAVAGGKSTEVELPLGRKGLGKQVESVSLTDNRGGVLRLSLAPATDIPSDRAARIVLAPARLAAASPRRFELDVELPGPVTFYPSPALVPDPPGYDQWYEFKPGSDHVAASAIGMADWSPEAAGAKGRITRRGAGLFYASNPIKLWGLNLCYRRGCCPEKKLADQRAAFYRKYGINAVRLHKFADGPDWAGILTAESCVSFEPEALERMDYFVSRLKRAGIFIKLSASFGSPSLGPADCKRVPYWREFAGKRSRGYVKTGAGAIFLSRELQDLKIEQMLNLLKHKNPYTGLTYAEDPAVAFVEIVNEESALFFGTLKQLQKSPTLRRRAAERFFAWLKARYGTKDKLEAAWGGKAIGSFGYEHLTDEGWEQGRIIPVGNPWYWDPAQLDGSQKFRRQRLLDTMLFLRELQDEFYARFAKAVRAAGYAGELVGSNWQAGRDYSHYSNLYSDYLVGTVDRHNYFGSTATMLRVPGSGILSAGMMQVADRPFMLSEWIHVWPNPWGVEGPSIIGAYGMGLQGWDVSFMFQNSDAGAFSRELGKQQWDVAAPQVLGVFPAVSRMVRRRDLRESEIVAPRYVHAPSLVRGKLSSADKTSLQHDVKFYDSDKVPARALAVARTVVEYTRDNRVTPAFDLAPYVRDGAMTASTGQLCWHPGSAARPLSGYFTVNAPATKAVVGFAPGVRCDLGEVAITLLSPFGALYLTARAPDGNIAAGRELLVVAIARARNTGMKMAADTVLLSRGRAPVLLEPVKARIEVKRPGAFKVVVLDHAGRRTDKELPVENHAFTIDGARDRTPYYMLEYR